MKNIFVITLALLMVVSFFGCTLNQIPYDNWQDNTDTEQKNPQSPSAASGKPATPEAPDNISPEFKKLMDEYEVFFDEYCEFMKKYMASDNPQAMLSDYLEFYAQYLETMESFTGLGDDDLTLAEKSYYLEVYTRITKKLAGVLDGTGNAENNATSDIDVAKQREEILAIAAEYRESRKEVILSAYDLCDYLLFLGYDEDLCVEICFTEGVDGFYNGAAMYDYERIAMFREQGYSREAIINYYYNGIYTYEEVVYLVDECIAGRRLTYVCSDDGELTLVEMNEVE